MPCLSEIQDRGADLIARGDAAGIVGLVNRQEIPEGMEAFDTAYTEYIAVKVTDIFDLNEESNL